jgi:hypothetical protein
MFALITIVRIAESSGSEEDDEDIESEKLSEDEDESKRRVEVDGRLFLGLLSLLGSGGS